MREVEFTHKFKINRHGTPFSERNNTGKIEVDINVNSVYLSGDKNGLLALAAKIIEVANCEVPGYHKHLDEVEIPNVSMSPKGLEFTIGKISG
ncbi:hypothetical protein [Alishewanella sp. SMS8]|uniref:Imm32 family immunity protein n=1 Tax=Alishewanella sp. SMS8 TaxID=2994676 RepID=UPI0027404BE4|nr:hypothetical protein [Alishewanella sp. SMS8]MDP5460480.1 hypothetical protein [Alishewanella sp. SMS8]